MSWEKARRINPDPEFSSAEVSGTHMDEPFALLMGHYIDSLTIDGHRLSTVTHMARQQDGTMMVSCLAENGATHLFSYDPIEEGPLQHLLLDAPSHD